MGISRIIIMGLLRTKYSGVSNSLIGSPGGGGGTVLDKIMKKIKIPKLISKPAIKICTWNVRSMTQAGKIYNAIQKMERMNIIIMRMGIRSWE